MKGNGEAKHKADRLKPDLFFNSARRAEDITNVDFDVERQRKALGELLKSGDKLDDDTTIKRLYNWFTLDYDTDGRTLKTFPLNEKKVAKAKKAAGFFSYVTIALDKTPLEAMAVYGLRDEQEKYFNQMKNQMNFGRQRTWPEEGKNGRLFIMFVGLIIASYMRHAWKSTPLKEQFSSSLEILDELCPIRCIEHKGKMRHITPFVGALVDICNALGISIPEECAPQYRSKQVRSKRRGRPWKQKIEKLKS